MRLTLEATETARYPRQHLRPRIVIEIADDDLSLTTMLEDLVQPALLAAGYPAELVQALTYEEAVTLRGPVVLQDAQSRMNAQCHQDEAPALYRKEPARDYE